MFSFSLSLLFIPFYSHTTFITCGFYTLTTSLSWLLLLPLPWVIPSVSAPACSVLCIPSPCKDLRFPGNASVWSCSVWQTSPAWRPTDAAGSLPDEPIEKGLRVRGDPWPWAHSYFWSWMGIIVLRECDPLSHIGEMFGRNTYVEGREVSVVKC